MVVDRIIRLQFAAFGLCLSIEKATGIDEIFQHQPPLGYRLSPQRHSLGRVDEQCHAGRVCVGPGESYPLGRQPGARLTSTFSVPELPKAFDTVNTTYYDYFNMYWGGFNMNQFVPQLMLGNALANSSNYPDFEPQWIELSTWHIGAQYFMGLCTSSDNPSSSAGTYCDDFIPKAATGTLIPVQPGEVIETSFELVLSHELVLMWLLEMWVVGESHRRSFVLIDKPFMGLLESTRTWDEEAYDNIFLGSCLENYGMVGPENYPPTWTVEMYIQSPKPATFWNDWYAERPACPWQPHSTVNSQNTTTHQWVKWNTTLDIPETVPHLKRPSQEQLTRNY